MNDSEQAAAARRAASTEDDDSRSTDVRPNGAPAANTQESSPKNTRKA
jgi:hypothetical protein